MTDPTPKKRFHTSLNMFIDLLFAPPLSSTHFFFPLTSTFCHSCNRDPALHTPVFTRDASPVLFTVVLTVASKFMLPDLYPKLLEFSEEMIGRCFGSGIIEIGLVQVRSSPLPFIRLG